MKRNGLRVHDRVHELLDIVQCEEGVLVHGAFMANSAMQALFVILTMGKCRVCLAVGVGFPKAMAALPLGAGALSRSGI